MQGVISWFIRNSVAANLLMLFIVAAGAISLSGIRVEGFPKITSNSIDISASYVGASAEQINENITKKIELAIQGLSGVKKVTSTSEEASTTITIQKEGGYDLERLLVDLKSRVESVELPQGVERPVVKRNEFNFPAMILQIYGDTDRETLQRLGERAKQVLLEQPEISKLKIWGDRERELSIELDPNKLQAYDLGFSNVSTALSNHNLRYRTGKIQSSTQTINLRADNQAYQLDEFANVAVQSRSDGTTLLLKDIATIHDDFVDDNVLVRYQNQPAIGIEILMSQQGNVIDISTAANRVKDQLTKEFPNTVKVDIWADQSGFVQDRLALLQSNALYGLLIVFALLALFLNTRLAFWVAMGVPICIMGTLWVMGIESVDYSLNDITIFGFIIVLGVLIDDAVVIGESVYEARIKDKDAYIATERGVQQVATATTFGIMTSIAAFYPMLMIDNEIGKILASFAGVVIIALFFSLVESKLILPAHLAHVPINQGPPKYLLGRFWYTVRKSCDRGLWWVNQSCYRPTLALMLRYRYASLIMFIATAALGIGLIFSGTIRTVFLPEIPGSVISVELVMDPQSPMQLTVENTEFITKKAQQVNATLLKKHPGQAPPITRIMSAVADSSNVYFWAELSPSEQRTSKSTEIADLWRTLTGSLEGVDQLSFNATEDEGSGGFEVLVQSTDIEQLKVATRELTATMTNLEDVNDVHNTLRSGKPEIRVELKKEGRSLGITQAMLAAHVGDAFGGLEIQKILRNNNEVSVVLRYPKQWRNSIHALRNSRIQTSDGGWLPLSSVASFKSQYVPAEIFHHQGKRTNSIEANINKDETSAEDVFEILEENIIPELTARYTGLEISAGGEIAENKEIQSDVIKSLVIALLLIFILLAVPLKSYWQPLVIMSVIPFGLTGAAFGHWIMGLPFSVLSFLGMMALTGIVVNDSLVMLTRYNEERNNGKPIDDALIQAGTGRFRAIFLTTVTTVGGLMPLLYETSEHAQYLIPAAVSLAFGEVFATVITLVLIPLIIRIIDDFSLRNVQSEVLVN